MPPKRATVCATAASTEAVSVTSAAIAMASSAFLRDDGGGFLRRLLHEIDAGDPRAFARIGDRRRLAVAPARPRGTGPEHDGRLALQAINH